jgi:DNA-binding CsgD family transcriptional regulator
MLQAGRAFEPRSRRADLVDGGVEVADVAEAHGVERVAHQELLEAIRPREGQVRGRTRAETEEASSLALDIDVPLVPARATAVIDHERSRRDLHGVERRPLGHGRLRAAYDAANRALGKAIADAIDTTRSAGLSPGAACSIPRPSGERSYALLVSPGPGPDSQSLDRNASAAVLIGDPDARLATPEQVVARLYGLTSSEARLAVAVASGDSLDGSAAAREISVSTVRQQMKQVFAKTGVRRQADLVRLLLTGPAAALNRRE